MNDSLKFEQIGIEWTSTFWDEGKEQRAWFCWKQNSALPTSDEKNVVCLIPVGVHGEEETPVLIPNTEVKLISGDYTAKSGKLARCRII